jgi:hypothetical protein
MSGNGNGCCADHHFDNARLEACIARFQRSGDTRHLGEIITLSEQRALVLIRHHHTACYCSEPELLSDVHLKLIRSVAKFDPSKGSAFTYVSKVIDSSLRTRVTNVRRHWLRHCELDDDLVNTLRAKIDDRTSLDDLAHRVRDAARTMLSDQREIEAQRWLIESFTDDGFASRRHACADACMGAFRLSHARSRELYDLSMLEVRRALYDDVKRRQQIVPGRLLGTRAQWMVQYQSLLTESEFTRFAVLMRDLAPYLLLLIVDPTKANNHRRDRNPTIGRQTLEWILYGHPDAVPLFQLDR